MQLAHSRRQLECNCRILDLLIILQSLRHIQQVKAQMAVLQAKNESGAHLVCSSVKSCNGIFVMNIYVVCHVPHHVYDPSLYKLGTVKVSLWACRQSLMRFKVLRFEVW